MSGLIQCYDCMKQGKDNEQCYIELDLFEQHQRDIHSYAIQLSVWNTIEGMEPRVRYILEHDKRAQSDPARVLELYTRLSPFKDQYRLIYDSNTRTIEQPTMPYHDFSAWRRYCASIERIDRRVREKSPELNGSPRARVQRAIRQETSTLYYGAKKV